MFASAGRRSIECIAPSSGQLFFPIRFQTAYQPPRLRRCSARSQACRVHTHVNALMIVSSAFCSQEPEHASLRGMRYIIAAGGAGSSGCPALARGKRTSKKPSNKMTMVPNK
jgi:hypothetical protein